MVSINYLLGPFSFLYGDDPLAPGIQDQIMALKWINDNIESFGDSKQITIFGESADSWSVSALLISPLSKNQTCDYAKRCLLFQTLSQFRQS